VKNSIPTAITHACNLLRDGICKILIGTKFVPVYSAPALDFADVALAGDSAPMIWIIGSHECDASVISQIRNAKAKAPHIRPVVLATYWSMGRMVSALRAGGCGCLDSDMSSENFVKVLDVIAAGGIVAYSEALFGLGSNIHLKHDLSAPGRCVHSEQSEVTLDQAEAPAFQMHQEHAINSIQGDDDYPAKGYSSEQQQPVAIGSLSAREKTILWLLTEGTSNKAIALQLVITEATVKVHIKSCLRKLHLHNRTQAAMWAAKHLPRAAHATRSSFNAEIVSN
jgi:two-component system, NarL family, nitrate/nitrite response regulator NarL